MQVANLPWLDGLVSTISHLAIGLLLVINGAFGLAIFLNRDRRFVDRWTKSVVVADATLLVAAFGTPVTAIAIKLGAKGVAFLAALPARMMPVK